MMRRTSFRCVAPTAAGTNATNQRTNATPAATKIKTTEDLRLYGGWRSRTVSLIAFLYNMFGYTKYGNPQVAFERGMSSSHRSFRMPLPWPAKKKIHLDGEMIVTSNVEDVGIVGNKGGEYPIRAKHPPWPWDRFWPEWGWMPTSYAWLYGEETKRGVQLWRKDLLKSEDAIARFGQPLAFHATRFRREFTRRLDTASGKHTHWLELVCCSVFDQCTQMQTGQDTKWCLRYDPDVMPVPRDWSKRVSELAVEVGTYKPKASQSWLSRYFDRTIKFDFPECFEEHRDAPGYLRDRVLGGKSSYCKGAKPLPPMTSEEGGSTVAAKHDVKTTTTTSPSWGQKCCGTSSKCCAEPTSSCVATSGFASVEGRTDELGNALDPWTPGEAFYFYAEATLAQLTIDVNTRDKQARILGRSEKYDRSKLYWETLFCESERILARTWADMNMGDEDKAVPDYCAEDKCLWKDTLRYRYSNDDAYKMPSSKEPDAFVNIVTDHRRVTFLHVEIIISTFDPAGRLVENLLLGMCKHPEWQDKVAREARPVLDRMEQTGKFTLQDWEDLKITKAFACEFLRSVPLFDIHQRTTSTPQLLADGTLVRNGNMVLVNYAAMCKQEECYPDPGTFNPERFMDLPPFPAHGSPESVAQSAKCPFAPGKINKSDAVCPFGIGTRVCSGIGWARVMTLLQFAAIVSDHRVSNDFALGTKLEMLNSAPNRPFPKIAKHFTFVPRRVDETTTTTTAAAAGSDQRHTLQ